MIPPHAWASPAAKPPIYWDSLLFRKLHWNGLRHWRGTQGVG